MRSLRNISISEFRKILSECGFEKARTKGGHESWTRAGIARPVVFQTHVDPIPEFIVKNGLRIMGLSKEEFLRMLD